MRIEIWSDVVCPWCWIGKRRLATALETFPHADEVEVVHRSFELDPTAPLKPVESVREALARKYGAGPAQTAEMMGRVADLAAAEGLVFDYDDAPHVRTVDAHRLLHLALAEGGVEQQDALQERLFAAYFSHGRDMSDHAVLREAALAAGLDAGRVDAVLASREFAAEFEADVAQARAYGATGVPFFVVDQRYGVSGAQPVEVFAQLLQRAWDDAHPAVQLVGGAPDGATCGLDGEGC